MKFRRYFQTALTKYLVFFFVILVITQLKKQTLYPFIHLVDSLLIICLGPLPEKNFSSEDQMENVKIMLNVQIKTYFSKSTTGEKMLFPAFIYSFIYDFKEVFYTFILPN